MAPLGQILNKRYASGLRGGKKKETVEELAESVDILDLPVLLFLHSRGGFAE